MKQLMDRAKEKVRGPLLRLLNGMPIRRSLDTGAQLILDTVQPFTMTSDERLVGLIDAVRYVVRNDIPGSVVECGVWRGGSMMATALALLDQGVSDRDLYLFDTYDGMSEPTDHDRDSQDRLAADLLRSAEKNEQIWCCASEEDVRANMLSTGYPEERIKLVKGRVESTVPKAHFGQLALLRLDTDWYESTRLELEYLYPILVPNGVLIIDDYGHWKGAQRATDEYFSARGISPLLHRLDYTGRMMIKTELSADQC